MAATPEERQHFGERLKAWREDRGYSQKRLADKVNEIEDTTYTRQSVSQWESGRNVPPRSVVAAIESVLVIDGELTTALGYGPVVAMDERISSLEAEMREVREILEQLALRPPPRRRPRGKGAGA